MLDEVPRAGAVPPSTRVGDSVITTIVPGVGTLKLENLVLDVNGTIAAGGALVPGVAEAIEALSAALHIVATTADTHGTATRLREALGVEIQVISEDGEALQKRRLVELLGADRTVVIGNGANDEEMLSSAALGIAVIGTEGAAHTALSAADIVTTSVLDALALLAQPARIAATLRR